jgi:hypothetical protein
LKKSNEGSVYGEEEEVTSPLKNAKRMPSSREAKKSLVFEKEKEKESREGVLTLSANMESAAKVDGVTCVGEEKMPGEHVNSTMHVHGEHGHAMLSEGGKDNPKKNQGTFKGLPLATPHDMAPKQGDDTEGRKRGRRQDDDMDIEDNRRMKCSRDEEGGSHKKNEARPADWLCE